MKLPERRPDIRSDGWPVCFFLVPIIWACVIAWILTGGLSR